MSGHDAIIIGAGMSGLAAGIRLAMFGKKVVILEKHAIPGGLNSYYQRRNFEEGGVRLFDVGLHALTNYAAKGEKNRPLTKLLKQLRFHWDDFKLQPQSHSLISFPGVTLKISNDFALLTQEVETHFPHERDGFMGLVEDVKTFNELDLHSPFASARARLACHIKDPLLLEMLLCPTLIYGSAWEDDMDWAQFVVMFKSLYFEGFARPEGGVRRIISLLVEKFTTLGGELRFKTSAGKILVREGAVRGVRTDSGEEILATQVFSSMGYPETAARLEGHSLATPPRVGRMTFMESIFVYDRKPDPKQNPATIIFHNEGPRYAYRPAENFFDGRSAVVCLPDNYAPLESSGEGTVRVTYMANYLQWRELPREAYEEKKDVVSQAAQDLIKKLLPTFEGVLRFRDVFSPTTVERYTWHFAGTVYGSPDKVRDGRTPVKNLFIIGTDQGFLGIVGAMLSGISMANLHGLMQAEAP